MPRDSPGDRAARSANPLPLDPPIRLSLDLPQAQGLIEWACGVVVVVPWLSEGDVVGDRSLLGGWGSVGPGVLQGEGRPGAGQLLVGWSAQGLAVDFADPMRRARGSRSGEHGIERRAAAQQSTNQVFGRPRRPRTTPKIR